MKRQALALALTMIAGGTGCDGRAITLFGEPNRCGASTQSPGELAVSADGFVDSIGAQVRMNYGQTPFADVPLMKRLITELGLRHVIDLAATDRAAIAELATVGAKSTLGVHEGDDLLALAASQGASLEALFNWLPNWNGTTSDPTALPRLRSYQQQIYQTVHSNAPLQHLTVATAAMTDAAAIAALGDVARWTDVGSLSLEAGVRAPGGAWLDEAIERQRVTTPQRPLLVQSMGYEVGPGPAQVSEIVQAKYLSRALLEHYRRGLIRTFISHLADGGAGAPFLKDRGLIRADGSVRPSFQTLKNLILLLRDPGPPHGLGRLAFDLRAAPEVHHLLMQKRSGAFYLALWREADSTDVDVTTLATLNWTAVQQVVVYQPQDGSGASQQFPLPVQTTISVSDRVTILEIFSTCP